MSQRSRLRRRIHRSAPELNITAFLNLMVILVPFLLITAVFSHMSILELNLPPAKKSEPQQKKKDKPQTNFELIIRKDSITVGDSLGGAIKSFMKTADGYDQKAIRELLIQIKQKFPKKLNITLLMEKNIPYDTLIFAMDTVRLVEVEEDGEMVKKELFPQISLGDAPPIEGATPR